LLSQYLKRRFYKKYYSKCYEGIYDLPILNWQMINDKKDLKYFIKEGEKLKGIFLDYFLRDLWEKTLDEFILKFGFSEHFLQIIRKKKEIANLKAEQIITGKKGLTAFIKIAEAELQELIGDENGGGNFYSIKGALDIAGFNIDVKKTTVAEFYTHIETLKKRK